MKAKKIPMRKCVGCGESKPQKELVRIAAGDGKVFVDPGGKAPGRGVYLCPDENCLKKAKKKQVLQRNFSVDIGGDELEKIFREVMKHGKT